MKIVKKIFHKLVLLPNVPLMVMFAITLVYKLYKENGFIDIAMVQSEDMKKYIDRLYPNHFKYFVSFCFYLLLFFYFY